MLSEECYSNFCILGKEPTLNVDITISHNRRFLTDAWYYCLYLALHLSHTNLGIGSVTRCELESTKKDPRSAARAAETVRDGDRVHERGKR